MRMTPRRKLPRNRSAAISAPAPSAACDSAPRPRFHRPIRILCVQAKEGMSMTSSMSKFAKILAAAALPLLGSVASVAQTPAPPPPAPIMPPSLPPSLEVDLMNNQTSAMFGAQWKTMEAKVVEVPPIPEHLPGYNAAYDISPHAGEAGFDDSKWPAIEAKDLSARRGGGHVSFIWFRSNLTIPARIGDFDTT